MYRAHPDCTASAMPLSEPQNLFQGLQSTSGNKQFCIHIAEESAMHYRSTPCAIGKPTWDFTTSRVAQCQESLLLPPPRRLFSSAIVCLFVR